MWVGVCAYTVTVCVLSCLSFFKILFVYFERGEGREKERERNISVRLFLLRPLLETWPETQACALTGNELVTLWFAGQHSIH